MKKQNIYIPGDKWLYVRIYTGYNTADKLLASVLQPIAKKLIRKKLAQCWFFIRYADPDIHLRFRIKFCDASAYQGVLSEIQKALKKYMDDDLIWKVELASYQPETERYGRLSIEHAENLFYYDSKATLSFLDQMDADGDKHSRWLFAMASADQLLNDFNFSLQDKKDLLFDLNKSFSKEFFKNKQLAQQLSTKYREYRKMIWGLMDRESEKSDNLSMMEILQSRTQASRTDIHEILKLYDEGKMEVGIEDLLSSMIHMLMNRIFSNNNRLHEMVLYDFLFRYYKSALAINIQSRRLS